MPIELATLKTRSLTALVFVLIMLGGLLINSWTFIVLFSIVMFGCLFEFSKIARLISNHNNFLYLLFAFMYIILPILMMIDLGINTTSSQLPSNKVILAGIFPANEPGLGNYSPLIPCAIIFSIWINDTMAYIIGSLIGKTRLSLISPKKTWEGTIGGIILNVAVLALLGSVIPGADFLSVLNWTTIAVICSIFGTLGDLIESMLKRRAGIKDSGSIMPGHGGFLDRFDSLLVATPFVWLYCKLIL